VAKLSLHRVVIEQRAVHDYREIKTNQKPKPKRISQTITEVNNLIKPSAVKRFLLALLLTG